MIIQEFPGISCDVKHHVIVHHLNEVDFTVKNVTLTNTCKRLPFLFFIMDPDITLFSPVYTFLYHEHTLLFQLVGRYVLIVGRKSVRN